MKTSCNYIIVYDTETAGLPNSKKVAFQDVPLMELALVCVDLQSLTICDEVDFIFPWDYKEGLTYEQQALDVNGLSKTICDENAMSLKDIYKECKKWFTKYKNPRQMCTLSGHNICSFDNPFLREFFKYMDDDLDNYVRYYIDTLQLAHISALEQIDYKLGTCCQIAGVDLVDAHRALNDTKANAQLLINYIKRLRGQGVVSDGQEQKKVRYREGFQLC